MPSGHLNAFGRRDYRLDWEGVDLPMLHRLCYPLLSYQGQGKDFKVRVGMNYYIYDVHFFEGQSPSLPQNKRPYADLVFIDMSMDFLDRCMSFRELKKLRDDYPQDETTRWLVDTFRSQGARTILAWRSTGWLHNGSLCVPTLHLDSLDDESLPPIFWMPLSHRLTSSEATMLRP